MKKDIYDKKSKKSKKNKTKKNKIKKSKKTKKIKKSGPTQKIKNKPFMELLYFYMEGCGYCKKFNPIWENLKMSIKDINLVKINGPKNKNLTQRYKVRGYPTIILIKDKFKIVYQGKRDIESLINFYKIMKKSQKIMTKSIGGKKYIINR